MYGLVQGQVTAVANLPTFLPSAALREPLLIARTITWPDLHIVII